MSSNCETAVQMSRENDTRDHTCLDITDNTYDILDQLYVKQCLFSIPKDQVRCIQYAVEIMIRFLLTSIYENPLFNELVCSNKAVKRTLLLFKTKPSIHYEFSDKNLLKVGSFYEQTKNHYPDEFDFLYVLAECDVEEYELMKDITAEMSDIFHLCLRETVLRPFPIGTCIEFVRYVRLHGPASMLEFTYGQYNDRSRKRSIFVDISPAVKVYTQYELPNEVNVQYSEWKGIILATGSFLLLKVFSAGHPKHRTKTIISITESEHNYVLRNMSETHKQVYRLLKSILNNESLGEELRERIRSEENQISVVCCRVFNPRVVYELPSYVIKTLMFHHCQHCIRNQRPETVKSCFVSVFDSILKLFRTELKMKVLCFWRKESAFSVSVQTLTGDTIEIADSYKSSIEVKKYLKEIRNGVRKDTQSDITPNTETTPLARKMVNVIQTHREKRERKKIFCKNTTVLGVHYVLFIVLIACMYISYIFLSNSIEKRGCMNGTDDTNGTSYASFDYFNPPSKLDWLNLSYIPRSVQFESGSDETMSNLFCLEYEATEAQEEVRTWANVSRIFNCGNNKTCAKVKLLYNKVGNDSFGQEQICNTQDYESRFRSKMFNPSDKGSSRNKKKLKCWRTKAACLDMMERQYRFASLLHEYQEICHEDCLPAFFRNAKELTCYDSKRFKEHSTTDIEICCCDKSHCDDPQLDERSKRQRSVADILIVFCSMTITSLCLFGLLCLKTRCELSKRQGQCSRRTLKLHTNYIKRVDLKEQKKRIKSIMEYIQTQ